MVRPEHHPVVVHEFLERLETIAKIDVCEISKNYSYLHDLDLSNTVAISMNVEVIADDDGIKTLWVRITVRSILKNHYKVETFMDGDIHNVITKLRALGGFPEAVPMIEPVEAKSQEYGQW